MATHTISGHTPQAGPLIVQVTVNHRPVPVTCPTPAHKVPALLVKRAAIVAGVAIGENFPLSVSEHGRFAVVADDLVIELRQGMEFLAVAPDDNS